jgi:Zn-dependent peptidase ImmA (M78 family)
MDRMTRAARKRCTRLLRELRFRQPFVLADFIDHVEQRRGRPIKLVPSDLDGTGPCGLMLATDDKDLVLFPESASQLHQEHIVVHEIGHLLFGHAEAAADVADEDAELEALRRLAPDIPLEMIRRLLARTSYEEQHEREAEVFATMLLATARRIGHEQAQLGDERSIRISSVFDPGNWAWAA